MFPSAFHPGFSYSIFLPFKDFSCFLENSAIDLELCICGHVSKFYKRGIFEMASQPHSPESTAILFIFNYFPISYTNYS